MPYITPEARVLVEGGEAGDLNIPGPGELNYVLSSIVDGYIQDKGGPKYATYNEVIGVLECMKLELYRRFVGPYEDQKIAENGEVFLHHLGTSNQRGKVCRFGKGGRR